MRTELLKALAQGWRLAENEYLLTGDDNWKHFMRVFQRELNLTVKETEELNALCLNMGV